MRVRLLVAVVGCLCSTSSLVNAAACDGFVDVDDANATYCPAVTFMKDRGVTVGCIDSAHFCPNDYVTRLQMALFMQRLANKAVFSQGGNAFAVTASVGTTDSQTIQLLVAGERALRIEPVPGESPRVIAGYKNNGTYLVKGATIAGGGAAGASAGGFACSSGFGCQNTVTDDYGTIGGGVGNVAGDNGGDDSNAPFATVAGGVSNAAGRGSAVGGGASNEASGDFAVIAGGSYNAATGTHSMVMGGSSNLAGGLYAFASGYGAKAQQDGEFVWGGAISENFDPGSAPHGWNGNAANTFNARATGGVWFVTGVDAFNQPTTGVYVNPGSGTWGSVSDRSLKENFADVDARDVLDRVLTMPVESWNYIAEGVNVRHIGPVAQDFHAAFALGPNDRTITSIDEGGIALAAIKGLNAKVMARDVEIAALNARNDRLEARLAALERSTAY